MTKLGISLVLVAILGAMGCVPNSIHPLYTDDNVVYDPALIGKWHEEGELAWIEFAEGEDDSYIFRMAEDENVVSTFHAKLVKLGEHTLLDIMPAEPSAEMGDFYRGHLLPMHSFYVVTETSPTLKFSVLNWEVFESDVKSGKAKIDFIDYEGHIILTSETDELGEFIVNLLQRKDATDHESEYIRTK